MVNIVLHAILFQPIEHQGVYIRPSEMLLGNRMTSCAKIAIQIPKTCIYTPLLFRILSTTITASVPAKITFKVRQCFLPAKYFTCLWRTSTFVTSMIKTVYKRSSLKEAFCCRYVAYLQRNTHTKVRFH